jgi:peptidoglycan/xylan/chitin deacetylase (PgdA/CDA1 family)
VILLPRILRKAAVSGVPLPAILRVSTRQDSEIFLTFDDGPNAELTPRLLDILGAHGVKATFFVNGVQVERHPDVAERITGEGHLIANHGYSHRKLTELDTREGLNEVERCQRVIEPFGAPRLFRPPHGLLGPRLYFRLIRAGYRIAYWTMDSGDSWDLPAERLAERMLQGAVPGTVILLHDDRANGVDAVAWFIAAAKKRGLRFGVLDPRQR